MSFANSTADVSWFQTTTASASSSIPSTIGRVPAEIVATARQLLAVAHVEVERIAGRDDVVEVTR